MVIGKRLVHHQKHYAGQKGQGQYDEDGHLYVKKRHKVHYITDLLAILEVFKGAFTSVDLFICSKTGITITITMLLFILGEVRFHTAKFHTDQIS